VKDVTGANDKLAQSLPEDGAKTLLVLVSRLERQVTPGIDDEAV
jgi:hypothetical protein